ncbi:MAG TPA: PEP-CTERM sorting domain-containing protein [Phycisphaerae bacterium]|nr:PEP-CTERM sorting domain-containing protein [Phycisphaerae bacterium]HNU45323.1 PEP-CTERM sorting domain-containing protein [Phycisphaerae bacterium]
MFRCGGLTGGAGRGLGRLLVVCALLGTLVLAVGSAAPARAGVLTFVDDYDGFVAGAPAEVRVIDFETLPDGSPSYAGAVITPDFNYTHLGATFYPRRDPGLYIYGNVVTGFELVADSYPSFERNWIIGNLVSPGSAVGTYFGSNATLSAYDVNGALIASVTHWESGEHFLGIVSDGPIAYATVDSGGAFALSGAFFFADVPEPRTVLLVVIGGIAAVKRRRAGTARSIR